MCMCVCEPIQHPSLLCSDSGSDMQMEWIFRHNLLYNHHSFEFERHYFCPVILFLLSLDRCLARYGAFLISFIQVP